MRFTRLSYVGYCPATSIAGPILESSSGLLPHSRVRCINSEVQAVRTLSLCQSFGVEAARAIWEFPKIGDPNIVL